MNDPWGLSGPEFLVVYWICLVAVTAFAILGGLLVRLGRAAEPLPTVTPRHLGFLRGGWWRLGEVIITLLIEQNALRANSKGRLYPTGAAPQDDLDRRVLTGADQRLGTYSYTLIRRLRGSSKLDAFRLTLVRAGLIVDGRRRRRFWLATAVLYAATLALGVVRLVVGVQGEFPVGYLALMLPLAAAGLVISGLLGRRRADEKITFRGRRLVKAPTLALLGAPGQVAAGGFSAHPDPDLRQALAETAKPYEPVGRSRGSTAYADGSGGAYTCGVTWSSSSGDSGGGGSSCGSGGGCGGGGGGS